MWILGLDDLDSIYPEAAVIKNSSNFIVFGGGTEMGSYEAISRMIGDKTIENKAVSEGKHGASLSKSEQAQRMAKPEWLRTLPKDELVAILGPVAIHGKKPNKFKDGELILL
jgi:type IV secretory pathway TraG/TraD family ATPase VirD4